MTDFDEALRRAEDGDPSAQEYLAYALLNGDGVPQNKEAARYWLLRAVEGELTLNLELPMPMVSKAFRLRVAVTKQLNVPTRADPFAAL